MTNIIKYALITFIFLCSCKSKENIDNKFKRNEDWAWVTDLNNNNGKWIPIGLETTCKEGRYKLFDCDGNLNESGKIINFKKSDTINFYNLEGDQVKQAYLDKDSILAWNFKDGKHQLFYTNCKIESICHYRNSKLVDSHIGYFKSGNIKYEFYRLNKTDIRKRMFNDSSSMVGELTERNGELHGSLKNWFSNGQLKYVEDYQNGIIHGESKHYYSNGQLEIIENYISGNLNGETRSYYESGELMGKAYFDDGVPIDSIVYYFKNGQLKKKGFFINGKENGEFIEFYENGNIELKYHFSNGELAGEQTEYYKDGRLKIRAKYENGVQVLFEEYENNSKK